MKQVLTQVARPGERRDEHGIEFGSSHMRGSRVAILQLSKKSLDKKRFLVLALLEIASLLEIGVFLTHQNLQALIDSDIQQVLKGGLENAQRHLRLKVWVDQVPQVFHVFQLVLKLAIHETSQEQLLRLMQAVLKAELIVAEQGLLLVEFEAQDIFLIVYVDVILNHPHVVRPQLHRVTYKLDFAPKQVVADTGQKSLIFDSFDSESRRGHLAHENELLLTV
mmetsp:Transcript_11386/g.13470  ORF Transcript_11386/g.13470 Transcript_11386/m.13470 type:complete len:222 (+) Transcript_11386:170-835(+)